jgi:PAS domain S-box-containing protein
MPKRPTYEELERRVRELEEAQSELKRAETAWREADEIYRKLIEFSPLSFLVTQEEKIVFANPAAATLFGATHQDEIVGSGPNEWIHPRFFEKAYQRRLQVMEMGKPLDPTELRIVRKDGTEAVVLANATLISYQGSPALLSVFNDVTEERCAVDALSDSKDQLLQSYQILSGVLEHTHMMAVFLDAEFNFVWVNQAYADTCNHEPNFFPGKNHFDLYPNEENQAIFRRVVETGEPFFITAKPFRFPDQPERGHTCWDWSLIPVKDDSGDVTGLVFTLAEVTARVRTEEALRESKLLLEATGRMARVGGWELDAETLEVSWTDETYHIHEVPTEYRPPLEEALHFYYPEDRERLSQAIQRALQQGEPYDLELRFITAKGNKLWTRTLCRPQIADGRVVRLRGTFQDITDRKLAHEALRESEEKFRSLVEQAAQMLFLHDLDGNLVDVNLAAVVATGYAREELTKMTVFDIDPDAVDRDDLRNYWKAIRPDDPPMMFEARHKRKDGSLYPAEVSISKITLKDRDYILGLAHDITERKQAEKSLQETQKRTATILKGIADTFYSVDKEWRFTTVNPAAERAPFGRLASELLGKVIWEMYPHLVGTRIHRHCLDAAEKHTMEHYEAQSPLNGRWYEVFMQGWDGGVDVYMRDITDRRRTENALRESEEKYRLLADNARDVIWIRDMNLMLTYVSPSIEVFSGYTVEEALNTDLADILTPDSARLAAETFRDAVQDLNTGEDLPDEYEIDLEHISKDGRKLWMQCKISPLKDDRGKVVGMLGVSRDITERKEAEKALWESTERFQKVFQSQLDAILVLNAENPARIVECNMAATQIFGYEPGELIHETIEKLHVDEHHRLKFQDELFSRIQGEGHLRNFEFSLKRKDGTVFPTEHSVFELTNDVGERTGWVSIIRDLTERKLMESRLRQAQKMESIGTLAGGIAHDFNNILSPIMVHAEMAMMDLPDDSPIQNGLKQIYRAGERARDLVKQILTFARKREGTRAQIRVAPIVKEAIKFLRSTIPTTIDIQSDIRCSQDIILGDPTELNQIIMNLCTNAAHAMEGKGGLIEVILDNEQVAAGSIMEIHELQPGPYLKLTVKDTGHGIEPRLLNKVFEPYFTTKETGRGTGMGLAIVHGIVKSYGGAVTVQSEMGKGTAFHVYMPLAEVNTEGPETQQGSWQLPRGNERILLVDDEEATVVATRMILERLGYTVTGQISSMEALKTFQNNPGQFDLVITDMTMPNLTGKELTIQVKAIRPDIPVILCTGFSEQIGERRAKEIDISAFVLKPLAMSQIAHTVREVLDRK